MEVSVPADSRKYLIINYLIANVRILFSPSSFILIAFYLLPIVSRGFALLLAKVSRTKDLLKFSGASERHMSTMLVDGRRRNLVSGFF